MVIGYDKFGQPFEVNDLVITTGKSQYITASGNKPWQIPKEKSGSRVLLGKVIKVNPKTVKIKVIRLDEFEPEYTRPRHRNIIAVTSTLEKAAMLTRLKDGV